MLRVTYEAVTSDPPRLIPLLPNELLSECTREGPRHLAMRGSEGSSGVIEVISRQLAACQFGTVAWCCGLTDSKQPIGNFYRRSSRVCRLALKSCSLAGV